MYTQPTVLKHGLEGGSCSIQTFRENTEATVRRWRVGGVRNEKREGGRQRADLSD